MKFGKFDFLRSDYVWCVKNQNVSVRSKIRYFLYLTRVIQVFIQVSVILFKGNNKLKSLSERFTQVLSCHLFQDICIKGKNIVLWCLSFQGDGVI